MNQINAIIGKLKEIQTKGGKKLLVKKQVEDDRRKIPDLSIILLQTQHSQKPLLFLVNSGSSMNLILQEVFVPSAEINGVNMNVTTINGDGVEIIGSVRTTLAKGSATLRRAEFYLSPGKMRSFDGILGND